MAKIRIAVEDLTRVEQMLSDAHIEYEVRVPNSDVPEWHKPILFERVNDPNPGTLLSREDIKSRLAERKHAKV